MTKIIHSQYVICIAGGIGITAFIGSLKYLLECPSSVIVTKRIHLIWIVKNGDELTWFAQIICDLYHKFWFYDEMDRFHVELYITNKKSLNNFNFCDNFQILQHRIQYGRPKFQHLFNFWKQLYEQKTVNVFCCGPKMLLKDIKKLCIRINLSEKIKFNYLHDSYS
ncbi:NADPH oxidase 4-like [Chrysoperla carnea]|uniref:NADPH oxidase 4-like n=1 Tax=Chrysoperla carnea TaxID=189513 RepID=UPI001D0775DE|nr:NADPH oxidase 4-like [Chrysoperla carnea]